MAIDNIIKAVQQASKIAKSGVVYDGKTLGFNVLQFKDLFHNRMNKQIKSYLDWDNKNETIHEILSNPVMREVYKGKRTFVSKNKNLLKEYLESSQYRKKLRKAGIPENQIQERINGLHDTQIRIDKTNTLGDTYGASYNPLGQVLFNPRELYPSRNELIQHELAHQLDLVTTANSTRLLKRRMPLEDINMPHSNVPLADNQNLRYQHNEKVLNDVKNKYLDMSKSNNPEYDKNYFLSLKEMVAKIQPLQINAWKNNWSPKQQIRFLPNTPNVNRMKALIGEKGIQELMEGFLKQGGKIE